jgi:DNA-binding PadR family transcriptional regulator
MGQTIKRTLATLAVARQLLDNPGDRRWSYELSEKLDISRGSINNILQRMANEGWLSDSWELDSSVSGPRRHYYEVTELGEAELYKLVHKYSLGHGNAIENRYADAG